MIKINLFIVWILQTIRIFLNQDFVCYLHPIFLRLWYFALCTMYLKVWCNFRHHWVTLTYTCSSKGLFQYWFSVTSQLSHYRLSFEAERSRNALLVSHFAKLSCMGNTQEISPTLRTQIIAITSVATALAWLKKRR